MTLCWIVKAKVRVDGIDDTQIRLQPGGSNITFLRRELNVREQGGLRCWQRLKSVRAGFVLHQGAQVYEARPFGIVRLLGLEAQTTGVEKQFLDRLEPWAKRIKLLKDRKGDAFFGKHLGMKYSTSFAKNVEGLGKVLAGFALGMR